MAGSYSMQQDFCVRRGFLYHFRTCAGLEIAQENFASILTDQINDDIIDIDEAEWVARQVFYENPLKTFNFKNCPKKL